MNAALGLTQSLAHFKYLFFVFSILAHYCSSGPSRFRSRTRAGIPFYSLELRTRSLPCFTELHSLFYVNGVKVVPAIIYELLSPVALAHWIMGDGTALPAGLLLCTDSYCLQDVVLLMNVLMIKFGLHCTCREIRPNQYRIYIREESMDKLRTIVLEHMDPSMLYKIGL